MSPRTEAIHLQLTQHMQQRGREGGREKWEFSYLGLGTDTSLAGNCFVPPTRHQCPGGPDATLLLDISRFVLLISALVTRASPIWVQGQDNSVSHSTYSARKGDRAVKKS